MKTELDFLNVLIMVSFVLAPIVTNILLLQNSKSYGIGHVLSLGVVIIGFLLDMTILFFIWPIFCVFGLFLQLKNRRNDLFSLKSIASFIPFVFSIIASIWFVSGSNDYHLLGYDKHWSLYAALHGNYLGWLFVGCLVSASSSNRPKHPWFTLGCYLSLVLFLMVSFGINGFPLLKDVGVIGLALVVPFFIGLHAFTTKHRISKFLSGLGLLGILFTMSLAVINEFAVLKPPLFLEVRSMVSLHGVVNALVVIPFFCLAVSLESGGIKNTT